MRALWTRIGLAYLAVGYALVGFWAAFAPTLASTRTSPARVATGSRRTAPTTST